MENLVMQPDFWKNKRVLITGHTGFKGGWLALWLSQLGADVTGLALAPNTQPNFFDTIGLAGSIAHHICDIRDARATRNLIADATPEIVLHLAAQPLVRLSYNEPVETYATNVMGTIHVLEAVRATPSVRATLVISSDKCYENKEQIWGYREHDKLGGHDPYSSSKACTEIVTHAYAQSFFIPDNRFSVLASARAGNVIGGGDWALDRLVPDLARGLMEGRAPILRNPDAVRPWQHVLEPLHGYMTLVEAIYGKDQNAPIAYNFGPDAAGQVDVGGLASAFCAAWGSGVTPQIQRDPNAVHEAHLLSLDITKARLQLGWKPAWDFARTVEETAHWYKDYADKQDMKRVTLEQIARYVETIDERVTTY